MKEKLKKIIRFAGNHLIAPLIPRQAGPLIMPDGAERILESHWADARTSPLWENRLGEQTYDLTIIIPVYNVEQYVETCIDSVLNQRTDYRCQIIVINDGSTDRSAEILRKYRRDDTFTVIEQTNSGVSKTRNVGLRNIRGQYVMFVDSDDFLPENAVQSLMGAAYALNADIVQGGYYHTNNNKIVGKSVYDDKISVSPNGVVAGMPWGKVFRAHLFEKICFPEGYWFEDTITTALLTHMAKNIATVSDMVYYYRGNESGITKSSQGKPKSIDTIWVLRSVLLARKKLGMTTDRDFYEHLLKMTVLCCQRTWKEPEIIKKSVFSMMREILRTERGGNTFFVGGKYRHLENAIEQGNYRKYCFLCKLGLY